MKKRIKLLTLSAVFATVATITAIPAYGDITTANNFVLVTGSDDTSNNIILITEFSNDGQGRILRTNKSVFIVSARQVKYWRVDSNAGWVTLQNATTGKIWRIPGHDMLTDQDLPACFTIKEGTDLEYVSHTCTTSGAQQQNW